VPVSRLPLKTCLAAWLFGQTALLCAQPLQMREAIEQALQRQPSLSALEQAALAARESAVADAELPDPSLKLGVQNLPVTGTDSYDIGAVDMTMTTIGFSQEMVRADKREAAAARSRAEAERWSAAGVELALDIEQAVAMQWLQLYQAVQQQKLIAAIRKELQSEQSVLQQQLASSAASADAVFALQTMAAFTQDRLLKAQGQERIARAALARWLGPVPNAQLPDELPEMPAPPSLSALQRQLSEHPDVLVGRAVEKASRFEAELAAVSSQSDWSWEVMYGKRFQDRADLLTVQFSIDLPWRQAQRQDRRFAEKTALAEQARFGTEDIRQRLQAQLLEAWSAWEVASARVDNYETVLLPAAKAQVETAGVGYRAARQSLAEIWKARRSLLEMQLEALDARVARALALVHLAHYHGGFSHVAN